MDDNVRLVPRWIRDTLLRIDDFIKRSELDGKPVTSSIRFAHLVPDYNDPTGNTFYSDDRMYTDGQPNNIYIRYCNLIVRWRKKGYIRRYKPDPSSPSIFSINPEFLPDDRRPTITVADPATYLKSALPAHPATALELLEAVATQRPLATVANFLKEVLPEHQELLTRKQPRPVDVQQLALADLARVTLTSVQADAAQTNSRIELRDVTMLEAANVLVPFGKVFQKPAETVIEATPEPAPVQRDTDVPF